MKYKHLQSDRAIRGITVGEDAALTAEIVRDIAAAFSRFLQERYSVTELRFAVGHDRRDSSPTLAEAAIEGLVQSGVQVLDCGVATPAALSFATRYEQSDCDGGMEITAAHLPPAYNGIRFFTREGEADSGDVERILQMAENVTSAETAGGVRAFDIMTPHADEVCAAIRRSSRVEPVEMRELYLHISGEDRDAYGNEVLADFEQYAEQLLAVAVEKFPYGGVRLRFRISVPRSWVLMRLSARGGALCIHMESYVQGGCDVMQACLDRFLVNYDRLSI